MAVRNFYRRVLVGLTQTAIHRLDQEFSYPVERCSDESTLVHPDLTHDVIVRDSVGDGRVTVSRK